MAGNDTPTYPSLLRSLATVEGDPDSFRGCLDVIASFLRAASPADVVDAVFRGESDRRATSELLANVEHVGFIAPPGLTPDDIGPMATASGFDREHKVFESRVVATELGAISGRPVRTVIFRAYGQVTPSRRIGIEVFVPSAEPATVRDWMQRGVASHVAIEMPRHDAEAFREVTNRFEAAGYGVPAFFVERPIALPQEDGSTFKTLYLDRRMGEQQSRIEVFSLNR